jgi:hypothetical protein
MYMRPPNSAASAAEAAQPYRSRLAQFCLIMPRLLPIYRSEQAFTKLDGAVPQRNTTRLPKNAKML